MKRHAPAAERNGEPIAQELERLLRAAAHAGQAPPASPSGTVLEVASGTGQHAVRFARRLAPLRWQPSDIDEAALASIEAHRLEAQLDNLLPPLRLDMAVADWTPPPDLRALVCINMIHIAPWDACQGLFAAAGRWLPADGLLITYGPYRFSGRFTSHSNETFDAGLRHRDPRWGVRDIDDLTALAATHGLAAPEPTAMPANNHVLVFRRRSGAG